MRINRTGQVRRPTNEREERKVLGTAGQHPVQIWAWEKENSPVSPYCIPNEYICAQLGHFLRLPVILGSVTVEIADKPKYWYTTLDLGEERPLPEVIPVECVALLPEECAGTVLFDIFICNGDRSPKNMYLNRNFAPPVLRLFDHESALLGATANQAEGRLTGSLKNQLGIPEHCLAPFISSQQLMNNRWMDRIERLPDYLIEETCQEASLYGMTDDEMHAVVAFLKERRHNLRHLLNEHKDKLGQ